MEWQSKTDGRQEQGQGSILSGWDSSSWSGRTHGSTKRKVGHRSDDERLSFNRQLKPHGYQWWYIDAISEDQSYSLSMIIFVGHVFSPYYYKARQRELNDLKLRPESFCAFNISLHALNKSAVNQLGSPSLWVLNEYSAEALALSPELIKRDQHCFKINQSMWHQSDDEITISINEVTKAFFQRMSNKIIGQVQLKLPRRFHHEINLDHTGKHKWMAVAPSADVVVSLEQPNLSFRGQAYHDSNWGDEPLENAFKSWTWSRAELNEGTCVLYDINEHGKDVNPRALFFSHQGTVEELDKKFVSSSLPKGLWGVHRPNRADHSDLAHLHKTLVDSPLYTRDLVHTELLGEKTLAMYESLNLHRFEQSWVRFLLPFRIRRW